jgi:hypothetical protein
LPGRLFLYLVTDAKLATPCVRYFVRLAAYPEMLHCNAAPGVELRHCCEVSQKNLGPPDAGPHKSKTEPQIEKEISMRSVRIVRFILLTITSLALSVLGATISSSVAEAATDGRYGLSNNAVNFPFPYHTPDEQQHLADMAAGTDVKWVAVLVWWSAAEPNPPQSQWQPGYDWQGPSGNWHQYDVTTVDEEVQDLAAYGVNIVMSFHNHPTWAGGNTCTTDGDRMCAKIYHAFSTQFHDGILDFVYFLASRYPQVAAFTLWNEPNLDGYFSPEPYSGWGGPVAEYVNLVLWPASWAIRTAHPGIPVVAGELFSERGGGNSTQCDNNWGYCTSWLNGWVDALVRYSYFADSFDKISIHNYSDDASGHYNAVANVVTKENSLGQSKQVWITEMNFGTGDAQFSYSDLATKACQVYAQMDYIFLWERSFWAFEHGGDDTDGPGHRLLTNHTDGWLPLPTWYYFKDVVDKTWSC